MTTAPNTITPESSCSVDDCDRPSYARGWCSMHYQRWYNHGHPMGGLWWLADSQKLAKARRQAKVTHTGARKAVER